MKNIFLLLLLFTGMVKAQIVNIPDANFKAKLLTSGSINNQIATDELDNFISIDANSDGEIQESEALAVYYLSVAVANISDLTGIERFSNLRQLYCSDNNLVQLNINNLTNLTTLGCNSNQLAQLNINNLVNLTYLRCSGNPLTQIDFSTLINLTYLDCSGISATGFDFSSLISLKTLYCRYCSLTQLDVTGLTNLINLNCSNNLLTSVSIQNLQNLRDFQCDFNQLSTVDFTGIHSLRYCTLSNNQLTSLTFEYITRITIFDISNNLFQDLDLSKIQYVYNVEESVDAYALYTGNPLRTLNMKNGIVDGMAAYAALNDINTWEFICGDDLSNEISLIQINRPGVVVNSYCSFVPGGNYNTIVGNIKYDIDNNGCDTSDINFSNIRININGVSIQGAAYTNIAGDYTFYTPAGSFDINPSIENPTWFDFSPVTATIPFADNNNNVATQDFCITPNGIHSDIEVVISPISFARPGFDATYQITYRNKGNQTVSSTINLIFDDSKTDFVSAIPLVDNLAVNSLSWNYSNLLPFESRTITVTLNVNSPTETPAVNIGDVLNFQTTISPVDTDENPQDNTFLYNQTVVGSYDPNDITCLEGNVVAPTEIGNYLHYAINFENTGTFQAENVVVKTEVDATKFDVGSLQLMNTNFPVDARITGNKVEFIFKNIQLPIGGHGHILLKIKTQNTLMTGDAVANRGDIYFDYNAPVDTGLANTVFQTLSNTVFEIDHFVAIYPNPASNEVTVNANNNIKSIQLYDAQGRIVLTRLIDDLVSNIDLSNYSKGLYFIKIITNKGAQVQKLLKN